MSVVWPPFWAAEQGGRVVALHATSVVSTAPVLKPIPIEVAKVYARITGTDLDAVFPSWIDTATAKVQNDTGIALLTQTRDLAFDGFPSSVVALPSGCSPLQSVTWIKSTDTSGVLNTLDASNYVVDTTSNPARIGLSVSGNWPTDLRYFQPLTMRIVCGYTAASLIPAPLVHAVGLLVGYYANEGSSRYADTGGLAAVSLLDSYEEAISPYCPVVLA